MITVEHLKIYHRYNGDVDSWARSGGNESLMSDEIWSQIENFESDIEVIKKGLASKKYAKEVMKRLEEKTDKESRVLLLQNKKPQSSSWFKRLFRSS